MEGLLDVRHRAGEPQVPFFPSSVDYFKATRFGESNHGVPILLAGTEPHGKLLRRKELVVEGAGGILNFLQEILQPSAIAQGQNDVEAQGLGCRELPDPLSLPIDNLFTNMPR